MAQVQMQGLQQGRHLCAQTGEELMKAVWWDRDMPAWTAEALMQGLQACTAQVHAWTGEVQVQGVWQGRGMPAQMEQAQM